MSSFRDPWKDIIANHVIQHLCTDPVTLLAISHTCRRLREAVRKMSFWNFAFCLDDYNPYEEEEEKDEKVCACKTNGFDVFLQMLGCLQTRMKPKFSEIECTSAEHMIGAILQPYLSLMHTERGCIYHVAPTIPHTCGDKVNCEVAFELRRREWLTMNAVGGLPIDFGCELDRVEFRRTFGISELHRCFTCIHQRNFAPLIDGTLILNRLCFLFGAREDKYDDASHMRFRYAWQPLIRWGNRIMVEIVDLERVAP
jgi:hypothetical protein